MGSNKKKPKKTFSNKKKKILKEIEDFRVQSSYNVSLPDLVVEQDKNITLPDGTHVIEKKTNNTSIDTRKNTDTKNMIDDSTLKNKTSSSLPKYDLDKLEIWKNLGDYENWLIAKGLDNHSLNSTQSVLDLDPKGLEIDPLKQQLQNNNTFNHVINN